MMEEYTRDGQGTNSTYGGAANGYSQETTQNPVEHMQGDVVNDQGQTVYHAQNQTTNGTGSTAFQTDRPTYGSPAYGSQTTGTYGQTTQTYGQPTYGSQQQTTQSNSYNSGSSTSSYGTQSSSNTYGTQYGGYVPPTGNGPTGGWNQGDSSAQPTKKNGNGMKVMAILAIAAILCVVVGAAYIGTHRHQIRIQVGSSSSKDTELSQADKGTDDKGHGGMIWDKDDAQDEEEDEASEAAQEEQADVSEIGNAIGTTTTKSDQITAVVTDVTQVVQAVMPAIVAIHNNYTMSARYFGQVYSEEQTASGSGIIVGKNDTELLIATNYHVVEGADSLEVIFVNDDTIEAAVKGTDSGMDLAVIAVQLADIPAQTASAISIATLGDSNALTVGEPAIAIGNALGYGQSVTTGVVSALNRAIELDDSEIGKDSEYFIQTDAAINPGNSGGALLNIQGEVIGINSNKIGGSAVEGMGYAIPISTAQPIIEKLMNEQTKIRVAAEKRGYIGISGVSVTSSVAQAYGMPQGVYVAEVIGESASAAGIQKGDVITRMDGEEITSMDDLQKRLEYYAAGQTVTLRIARQDGTGYRYGDAQVTLGSSASTASTDENAGERGDQYDGALPGGNGSGSGWGSGDSFQMPGFPGFNFNFPDGSGSGSDGNGSWNYYEDENGNRTWEYHFGG